MDCWRKTLHAAELKRSDVEAAREDWFVSQNTLDPVRLVFLDENAAAINMIHRYGSPPRRRRREIAVLQGL